MHLWGWHYAAWRLTWVEPPLEGHAVARWCAELGHGSCKPTHHQIVVLRHGLALLEEPVKVVMACKHKISAFHHSIQNEIHRGLKILQKIFFAETSHISTLSTRLCSCLQWVSATAKNASSSGHGKGSGPMCSV